MAWPQFSPFVERPDPDGHLDGGHPGLGVVGWGSRDQSIFCDKGRDDESPGNASSIPSTESLVSSWETSLSFFAGLAQVSRVVRSGYCCATWTLSPTDRAIFISFEKLKHVNFVPIYKYILYEITLIFILKNHTLDYWQNFNFTDMWLEHRRFNIFPSGNTV